LGFLRIGGPWGAAGVRRQNILDKSDEPVARLLALSRELERLVLEIDRDPVMKEQTRADEHVQLRRSNPISNSG